MAKTTARHVARIRRNVASQYLLQIAKYIFPFVTLPYLTRQLGPDAYAVRAYVLAAMALFQVLLDYGFTSYGTKVVAEAAGDFVEVCRTLTCVVALRSFLCVLGAAIVYVVSVNIPIMKENLAFVYVAYLGICCKAMLPDFIFQGQQDMGILTRRFVFSQAVSVILIFLLVHSPEDLILVAFCEGAASLVALLWSWHNVLFKRCLGFVRVPMSLLASAFKASSVFFASNAATTIFTALTTLMIGLYIDDLAQVSYWSLALTAVSAIQSLYTPITNSIYPHVCETKDISVVKRYLKIGLPVVFVGTVLFAQLSGLLMTILGGSEYVAGSYVVKLVSPLLLLSFPAMLIGFPILAAVDRVKQLTLSSVIASVFHVAGLFVLLSIGCFGIVEIAVLRCLTEAVLLGMRVAFVALWMKAGRGAEDNGVVR